MIILIVIDLLLYAITLAFAMGFIADGLWKIMNRLDIILWRLLRFGMDCGLAILLMYIPVWAGYLIPLHGFVYTIIARYGYMIATLIGCGISQQTKWIPIAIMNYIIPLDPEDEEQ